MSVLTRWLSPLVANEPSQYALEENREVLLKPHGRRRRNASL